MRLLRRAEAPLDAGQRVFRRAAWPYLFTALLLGGGTAAALIAGFAGHKIFWLFALPLALVAGLFRQMAAAALAETNWLVRSDARTLLVQFRSYLNRHFPDDRPSVLQLGWEEVSSLRKTKETVRVLDNRGAPASRNLTYIDIRLKSADTEALRAALQYERDCEAPKIGLSRTKFQDYPVLLPQADLLRIVWNGATPGADAALLQLGESAPVDSASSLAPAADIEAQVLKLVELGEKLEAVKLIRAGYGYGLEKAVALYDELAAKRRRNA